MEHIVYREEDDEESEAVAVQSSPAADSQETHGYDQTQLEQYWAWYYYQQQQQPATLPAPTAEPEKPPEPEPPKKMARRQVGRPDKRSKDAKGMGGTYNIFYDRWYTEGERRGLNLEKALTRCNPEKDSGATKGKDPGQYFCVHFAHGCCTKGPDCQFLHRLPTVNDRFELTRDVFGREKFRDDRDDMGGVGTFERDNRTLYVGRVGSYKDMDLAVRRHFEIWGPIENIRILEAKAVAFVRYKYRVHAEFAKEAMYGQSLDKNEVLNVRWATEDPNPRVIEEIKQRNQEMALQRIVEKLPQIGDHGNILDYESYFSDASKSNNDVGPVSGDPMFGYSYGQQQSSSTTLPYTLDSSYYAYNYETTPAVNQTVTANAQLQTQPIFSKDAVDFAANVNVGKPVTGKRKPPPPPPRPKGKIVKKDE
ncbi:Pre-mRNA-splicing factor [Nowakowskiella sp. JEL0407]|nr:Pre-mRNA-splicing factor [Nowakowskiella sp. JEL0407]